MKVYAGEDDGFMTMQIGLDMNSAMNPIGGYSLSS
jgi:hypothetical protein